MIFSNYKAVIFPMLSEFNCKIGRIIDRLGGEIVNFWRQQISLH